LRVDVNGKLDFFSRVDKAFNTTGFGLCFLSYLAASIYHINTCTDVIPNRLAILHA
jgi:hypothetical protein